MTDTLSLDALVVALSACRRVVLGGTVVTLRMAGTDTAERMRRWILL